MAQNSTKILFIVQLPPPVHGVSTINQLVIENPYLATFQKKIINLNFSKNIAELRKFSIEKAIKSLSIFLKIFFQLFFFQPHIVYFTLFPFGKAFFFRDIFYLALIKFFKPKIILHFHNIGISQESKNKFKRLIYNWAFSNLHIIFLSENIKTKEIANLSLKNTRYSIVPNGIKKVDLEKFKDKGKNREKLNILFFSNFFKEKGMFLLLEVFKNLSHKYAHLTLTIAGQDFDNNKQKMEHFIKNNSLSEKVNIKTNVFDEEKYKLFSLADIFVFPSYFDEAFPLVILEAMQMQLPIIAPNIETITDIINNRHNGLIFKNKKDLTNKIEQLILNKNLRQQLAQKAKKEYFKKYTMETFHKNIFNIFNKLIYE